MPLTMSTSERRCGATGSTRPREACTLQTESSTVTYCSCPPVRSISVRPRVGRISASSPVTPCEWFSLVETWTLSDVCRSACSVASVSDIAETKLPPRPMNTFTLPSRMARTVSTLS